MRRLWREPSCGVLGRPSSFLLGLPTLPPLQEQSGLTLKGRSNATQGAAATEALTTATAAFSLAAVSSVQHACRRVPNFIGLVFIHGSRGRCWSGRLLLLPLCLRLGWHRCWRRGCGRSSLNWGWCTLAARCSGHHRLILGLVGSHAGRRGIAGLSRCYGKLHQESSGGCR